MKALKERNNPVNKLRTKLGALSEKTPFQRGKDDAAQGKKAPSFPTTDSSWAERLYNQGYQSHHRTIAGE